LVVNFAPSDTLQVTGFDLAASASCEFSFTVGTVDTAGTYVNASDNVTLLAEPRADDVAYSADFLPFDATLLVLDIGDIAKGITPSVANVGDTVTVTLAIFLQPGEQVSFADTLPAVLSGTNAVVIDQAGGTGTCSSGITTFNGSSASGVLPERSNTNSALCYVQFTSDCVAAGSETNTVGFEGVFGTIRPLETASAPIECIDPNALPGTGGRPVSNVPLWAGIAALIALVGGGLVSKIRQRAV